MAQSESDLVIHYTKLFKKLTLSIENKSGRDIYIASPDEVSCNGDSTITISFFGSNKEYTGGQLIGKGKSVEQKFEMVSGCHAKRVTVEYAYHEPQPGEKVNSKIATLPPQSLIK